MKKINIIIFIMVGICAVASCKVSCRVVVINGNKSISYAAQTQVYTAKNGINIEVSNVYLESASSGKPLEEEITRETSEDMTVFRGESFTLYVYSNTMVLDIKANEEPEPRYLYIDYSAECYDPYGIRIFQAGKPQ